MQASAFVSSKSGQHLVEDVVVPFAGQWTHYARLIQEVAVDLSPVQRSVRYLHLDEVTLKIQQKYEY